MPNPYFLGLDISTTATKALLIDSAGQVVAVASSAYPFETPRPLWSEQNPDLWWQGTQQSIRAALQKSGLNPAQIGGIGLSGQMHGLVLLDQAGNLLRPAILWNDQRSQNQCDEIHRRIGREKFIQITGNLALTGFTAPKILWVQENEPETYAKIAHILLPKDFVRYKLTSDFGMDVSDAAGTVLMNLQARAWSEEVLTALDIPRAWLPGLYEGTQITGRLSPSAAEATGLLAETPVMAGGGDQAAGAVGMGVVTPGVIGLTVGTSGVVFASTPSALIEPEGRLHAFCHAVPGLWHFMGVMLSAAGSLQWYRDTLAPGVSFDDLLKEAESIPAGSEGLLFLPYLSGERTPHPDPLARGAFVGLTVRHGRGHLTRALLEGVAYGLKDSFTLIKNAGLGEIRQVRASGGGTKSALWRQILASALEAELVTVNTAEGAAYGAALLAAVGAGGFSSVAAACAAAVIISGQTLPDRAQSDAYAKIYPNYQELYPALTSIFKKQRI